MAMLKVLSLSLSFPMCTMAWLNQVSVVLPTVPFWGLSIACLLSPLSPASKSKMPSFRVPVPRAPVYPTKATPKAAPHKGPLPAPIFVSCACRFSFSLLIIITQGLYSLMLFIHSFNNWFLFFRIRSWGSQTVLGSGSRLSHSLLSGASFIGDRRSICSGLQGLWELVGRGDSWAEA